MNKSFFVQIIGIRASLFEEHVRQLDCDVEVISTPDEMSSKADICLACGVHYIIKSKYLKIPRLGIWGFHESPLPKGRGCAPIHWTVLNKHNELSVSFFELINKMDEGRLLGQLSAKISKHALLEDLRLVAANLSKDLLSKYLLRFLLGQATPYEQKGVVSYYSKRTPKDSELNFDKTLSELWDQIRVCDNEDYPAWFEVDGEKIILKRSKAVNS